MSTRTRPRKYQHLLFSLSNQSDCYPSGGVDHLQLQGVTERLTFHQGDGVAAGQSLQHGAWWEELGLSHQLRKSSRSSFRHPPDVHAVLGQSPRLESKKKKRKKIVRNAWSSVQDLKMNCKQIEQSAVSFLWSSRRNLFRDLTVQ